MNQFEKLQNLIAAITAAENSGEIHQLFIFHKAEGVHICLTGGVQNVNLTIPEEAIKQIIKYIGELKS